MIKLYDKETDQLIGRIDETELDILRTELEEESLNDRDYYIDAATIEYLRDQEAPPHLIELLERALGERESMEIEWSEDP